MNQLEGSVSDELALDAWEAALELAISPKDDAALLVRMSGAYYRMGDGYTARVQDHQSSKNTGMFHLNMPPIENMGAVRKTQEKHRQSFAAMAAKKSQTNSGNSIS